MPAGNLAVCPVPFTSARAFVAPGSWLVEGTKYVCRQGLLRMDLLLTAVGAEPREEESPVELFFIMDATWPQGAAAVRWNRITSSLTKFIQCTHAHTIHIYINGHLTLSGYSQTLNLVLNKIATTNQNNVYNKKGGAPGVMAIVIGNGHGDTSSNPRQDWLPFT